jgi:hypothetical protein
MEQNDQDLEAARISAKRIELLQQDKRQQKVLAMKTTRTEDSTDEDEWDDAHNFDDLLEDECHQINAIRMKQGKRTIAPWRRGNRMPKDLSELVCHYCNKKGHYQKVCRKRIKEKGKYVYKNANANAITDPKEEATTENPPQASTMSIQDFYRVNTLRNLN